MTLTVTLDGRSSGRLRSFAKRTASKAAAISMRLVKPHKMAVTNLLQMPLFLIGTGFVDFASFHVNHGIGWLVTGISLIICEHLAADE